CKQEMTLERVKTNSKNEKIFLMIIRFKKYHCKTCKWYGNLFMYTLPKNYKKIMLNYLIIISFVILSRVIVSTLIKKALSP
ncbi:MAG: hypothetical protein NTU73_10815, partial [Ignavibacteriae bacterium]|nr:hypothetical protein [Ignavibacteriota bacterium]